MILNIEKGRMAIKANWLSWQVKAIHNQTQGQTFGKGSQNWRLYPEKQYLKNDSSNISGKQQHCRILAPCRERVGQVEASQNQS